MKMKPPKENRLPLIGKYVKITFTRAARITLTMSQKKKENESTDFLKQKKKKKKERKKNLIKHQPDYQNIES